MVLKNLLIPTKSKEIIAWCEENVSPIKKHEMQPFNAGVKIGGEGWEVTASGQSVRLYIEDPVIFSFAALKFASTNNT